jgi:hypothetical protein
MSNESGSQKQSRAQKVLEALKAGPMKLSEVFAILGTRGGKSIEVLRKSGAIEEFIAENPDYEAGKPGQKPMCKWVRLGVGEYPKHGASISKETLERAAKLLEQHGYTVIAPKQN